MPRKFLNTTNLFIAVFSAAFLSACGNDGASTSDADSSLKVSLPLAAPSEIVAEDVASGPCGNALIIELPRISSKDWNKGVSRQSAAILLEADTVSDLGNYTSVQLSTEAESRDILSTKQVNKGRQIINLQGGLIADIADVSYVCFKA